MIAIGLGQGGGRLANLISPYMDQVIAINSNETDLEDVTAKNAKKVVMSDENG